MTPSPQANAPLPPLPNLPGAGSSPAPDSGGGMAAIMSGLSPVKSGVDQILAACRQIVQSGAIPGAEQICAQIIAQAASLLPLAAQQAMVPGGGGMGGGMSAPPAGGGGTPPPIGQ